MVQQGIVFVIGYENGVSGCYVHPSELDSDSGIFCPSNNIEPIPLTEEYLLKFGFEKRNEGTSDAWHIGMNPVTHDWLFDLVWIKGYQYPFYRNGLFMIKSVHQLQNLYYAMTGEELTLTETLKVKE